MLEREHGPHGNPSRVGFQHKVSMRIWDSDNCFIEQAMIDILKILTKGLV